jgi:hypothetical protein
MLIQFLKEQTVDRQTTYTQLSQPVGCVTLKPPGTPVTLGSVAYSALVAAQTLVIQQSSEPLWGTGRAGSEAGLERPRKADRQAGGRGGGEDGRVGRQAGRQADRQIDGRQARRLTHHGPLRQTDRRTETHLCARKGIKVVAVGVVEHFRSSYGVHDVGAAEVGGYASIAALGGAGHEHILCMLYMKT